MSASFKPYGELDAAVHVSMTEAEAKALHALSVYGADAFLKVFYEKLGKAYLGPHEAGLRSLFENAAAQVSTVTDRLDETRAVFKGRMKAIRLEDFERLTKAAVELHERKAANPTAADQLP